MIINGTLSLYSLSLSLSPLSLSLSLSLSLLAKLNNGIWISSPFLHFNSNLFTSISGLYLRLWTTYGVWIIVKQRKEKHSVHHTCLFVSCKSTYQRQSRNNIFSFTCFKVLKCLTAQPKTCMLIQCSDIAAFYDCACVMYKWHTLKMTLTKLEQWGHWYKCIYLCHKFIILLIVYSGKRETLTGTEREERDWKTDR